MKKVYFIRHAKSSWETVTDDHDRILSSRGFHDADLVGRYLKGENVNVDAVYSSSANRAETTARIICENLEIPLSDIKLSKKLYDFDGKDVMHFIKNEIPNEVNSILIFGHNPCFTSLVNTLGTKVFFNFPTCGVAAIEFDSVDWKEIIDGRTFFSLTPKQIR